ncbi:MAG: RNA polymerase sigma factor [Blastocatellia bacterium]
MQKLRPGWDCYFRYHRKPEARIEMVEFDGLDADRPDLALISEGEFSRPQLMEWLDELESGDRELLTLRFVEGLSYEELAKIFELPVGTIKSRLFYARRRLARIIETSNPYLTRSRKRN